MKYCFYGLYVTGVIVLSVLPGSGAPSPIWDKLAHCLIYMGMAILAAFTFQPGRSYRYSLIFAILLGVSLEGIQSFIPLRTASLYDGLANTLGVIAGAVIWRKKGLPLARNG